MGARLSMHNTRGSSDVPDASQFEACKRRRMSPSFWDGSPRLIPSLPDEISIQILARVPRICHFIVKLVSRSWRATLVSGELYKVRKELGTTEEWLYVLTKAEGEKLIWHGLDPVSGRWQRLPMMPNVAVDDGMKKRGFAGLWFWNRVSSNVIADAIRGWLGRKDALDEIPFCGCAIGAVGGCLYVIGGFCRASAVSSVCRYDPIINSWVEKSSMSAERAYCKTAVLEEKLYVIGGVTRGRGGLTPLQSAEVFDPSTDNWSEVPSMPFSKAQILPTAFLTDLLKPIATGLTSYRGKLYVPQSLYCWPFFVDVGGEVYDPETNSWTEMPLGMGDGWPAKQAGTKLSVVVDEELYALDPSGSHNSARIKVYDHQDDIWKVIDGDVPIRDLTYSESPYLLASFLGKLHVITKDGNNNISVMQFDWQNKLPSMTATSSLGVHSGSDAASSSSSSSSSASSGNNNVWKVIASRVAGSSELVGCQVLNV